MMTELERILDMQSQLEVLTTYVDGAAVEPESRAWRCMVIAKLARGLAEKADALEAILNNEANA